MDAFRLNYFIRYRQVHSNNRWHKFHDSIRKFFGCMGHNLAWLYFSKNDDFDCFAFILYCDFVMVSLIVEPAQWLIQEHCWKITLDQNWVSIPSRHKTSLVNDLPHSVSTASITFFRQIILFYYGLSFRSPQLQFYSLSLMLHLQNNNTKSKLWFPK